MAPRYAGSPGAAPTTAAHGPPYAHGVSRRTWTLLLSMILIVVFGVLGGIATVPYVALGPGPTYDTLGDVGGTTVVTIDGEETFPTGGHLNMTTVSVSSELTLFTALGKWLSGDHALVPREEIYPPDRTEDEVQQQQAQAFQDSETAAENAALTHLGYPTVVIANRVVDDSPAVGKLEPGDVLKTLNGTDLTTAEQVRESLAGTRPGDTVDVVYTRDGTDGTTQVTLGTRDDRENGFLGVEPANQPKVDFDITISLADVGGPSAGLMFALAIVDKLTADELNGGQFVAGTGEITSDGQVGPIGGIPFKMAKARSVGATIFLVPQDNCLEAKQRVPDGLRLVKVTTLDDAVSSLESLATGGDAPTC